MSDLRPDFHNELEELRNEVARLGAYVVELIPRVTDILLQQDLEGAEYVLRNDTDIDVRSTTVEERAIMLLALQAPVARAHGLAFRVEVSPALPPLLVGDALRVRQVLFNLLGNAIKFTQHGGVGLDASPGAGGAGLRLVVHDTGPGLDPAEQARLFRRFAQGDAGLACGGSGLGLSISRELVRAMGGAIAVESAPGAGARFVVDLPFPAAG